MKQIKLSGREMAILRAIDYAVGSTGLELHERTNIDPADVADILNGLCDVGYVEAVPDCKLVTLENCAALRFEVNPSYWQQLKEAMRRR